MRSPTSEKLEIIRLVAESHLSARLTPAKLGIPRPTFYRWYDRYLQRGEAGLQDQSPKLKHVWNRMPDEVKRKVVDFALNETELSPRELAVTFTDQESYIVSWKLRTNMRAEDVTDTLDLSLQASGCNQVHVVHKPRLLSDNGSSYVSGNLAEEQRHEALARGAISSTDPGQDRTLAPNSQEPHPAGKLLPA